LEFSGLTATQSFFYGLTRDGEIHRFRKDGTGLKQVGFSDNRFLFAEDHELYNCTPGEVKRLMNGVWLDFLPRRFDTICATGDTFYGLIANGPVYRILKSELPYL
jgi:hypothetical protein